MKRRSLFKWFAGAGAAVAVAAVPEVKEAVKQPAFNAGGEWAFGPLLPQAERQAFIGGFQVIEDTNRPVAPILSDWIDGNKINCTHIACGSITASTIRSGSISITKLKPYVEEGRDLIHDGDPNAGPIKIAKIEMPTIFLEKNS